MKNVVILISGRGSNMRSIVEDASATGSPYRVAAVISNQPSAEGLTWAKAQGLVTESLDHRSFPSRDAFDAALAGLIDRFSPDIVVLAGFMRILGENFVQRYEGRMLNIHPSLLPAFPGMHTHRQALQYGSKLHGCTVHFVTANLDHGPVIVQAAVPVLPDDDENTLAERVLAEEHRIYPLALRWLAEGRLVVRDGVVRVKQAEDWKAQGATQTLVFPA
ncbi:MAG TPA: phosphoribosylglycinamide formyltransferase [Burkholderiales bacterium]|nr:phosphoribosylglycinamide formyltransferase [Burkholderiales bacterium]